MGSVSSETRSSSTWRCEARSPVSRAAARRGARPPGAVRSPRGSVVGALLPSSAGPRALDLRRADADLLTLPRDLQRSRSGPRRRLAGASAASSSFGRGVCCCGDAHGSWESGSGLASDLPSNAVAFRATLGLSHRRYGRRARPQSLFFSSDFERSATFVKIVPTN